MAEKILSSKKLKIPASFVEANEYLYARGWTDGLPVIPPTPERVLSFLATVDRDPNEVIARVNPTRAKVTIEKVAINAVMAGCLPGYFPVVLAAIEAITSPPFKLSPTGTSPTVPFLVINGPCRKALGINCEYNALGSGYRANATIGRAVRLALVNIGRVATRPDVQGVLDQTTLGQPTKFTLCLGENEEANPWEPLHVERGFDKATSTVTIFDALSLVNILDTHSRTAKGLLKTISGSMGIMGSNNLCHYATESVLCLGPEHSTTLAREGLSKADIKRYLYENVKLPLSVFSDEVAQFLRESKRPAADGMVHIAAKPEHINIIVSGGLGPHSVFIPSHGRGVTSSTKPIKLPPG